MSLTLNLPINSVSFGQTSTLFLRTIFDSKKDIDPIVFPIGKVDLSSQKLPDEFTKWLSEKITEASEKHSRSNKCFKLWHLMNGGLESFSREQVLLSFYELDSPTKSEVNCVKNNKTAFTSEYTCQQFKSLGANSSYVPLAFDSYNFSTTGKKYNDDRITFNLCGKFEKRKHHEKIIKAWIKKFGSNQKYALNCSIYNSFFNEQVNNQIIMKIMDGKPKPFNVNFLPFMKENPLYNDYLNSGNIVIGMSGGEGWGLPEFHSVALGKHAVVMGAHGYLGWANEKNSVLVSPNGKISSEDGVFFKSGLPYNQGNIFDFDEDEFLTGCEKAIARFESSPVNSDGLLLQQEFSKEKFVDNVLNLL